MIFSLEKEEGNPRVHKIINESRGHYANWNKIRQRRINTAWYHLHVDSKTRKENQIEWWLPGA